MQKKYQVHKIDALLYGDDWVYNDVQQLGKVYITGNPTKTKILNALYRNNYIPKVDKDAYYIDDSDIDDFVLSLREEESDKPLFDLIELE